MTVTIITADCRQALRDLPDKSVHVVVTSPPYFGLRDYGTGTWVGGDPACKHVVGNQVGDSKAPLAITGGMSPGTDAWACRRCGAARVDAQMGLEATPAAFVAALVDLFEEIRRVLRDDGTVWLNLGDSYANDGKWGGATGGKHVAGLHGDTGVGRLRRATGLKSKDLVGIPWRCAIALQDAGWYLRQEIIWSKPNPMPESVTDRCTKAHESLFLLAKSEVYFFDQEAIAEPCSANTHARLSQDVEKLAEVGSGTKSNHSMDQALQLRPLKRNKRSVWEVATQPFSGEFCKVCRSYFEGADLRALRTQIVEKDGHRVRLRWCSCGANSWLAHFATYPPALIEPCILASTSQFGCCADCGAPLERLTERTDQVRDDFLGSSFNVGRTAKRATQTGNPPQGGARYVKITTGARRTCSCPTEAVRAAVVLDPFGGAGTTALVADRLGRDAILVELNPDYAEMSAQRIGREIAAKRPLFSRVARWLPPTPAPEDTKPAPPEVCAPAFLSAAAS